MDTYNSYMTVNSTDPGGVVWWIERTSGTDCTEIYAKYQNVDYFLPGNTNQMRRFWTSSDSNCQILPVCFCLRPYGTVCSSTIFHAPAYEFEFPDDFCSGLPSKYRDDLLAGVTFTPSADNLEQWAAHPTNPAIGLCGLPTNFYYMHSGPCVSQLTLTQTLYAGGCSPAGSNLYWSIDVLFENTPPTVQKRITITAVAYDITGSGAPPLTVIYRLILGTSENVKSSDPSVNPLLQEMSVPLWSSPTDGSSNYCSDSPIILRPVF